MADEHPQNLEPGDEVAPEVPSAGENVCQTCGGSGELDGGDCRNCGGRGMVVEAVGGG
ncbi:MAG: hypothetical protein M3131_09360 [Actinomycetota bacterium]|nr:hypothetical protein [Actinomycetota bacterium]